MVIDKPAGFRELLRGVGKLSRGFRVVLVLKFLLGRARFVWGLRENRLQPVGFCHAAGRPNKLKRVLQAA